MELYNQLHRWHLELRQAFEEAQVTADQVGALQGKLGRVLEDLSAYSRDRRKCHINTLTGAVYRGHAAMDAARERGEPLIEVSERVVQAVETGLQCLGRREGKAKRRRARTARSRPRERK